MFLIVKSLALRAQVLLFLLIVMAGLTAFFLLGGEIVHATTITFDVDANGDPINAPGNFSQTLPLTTLYATLGVTFVGPTGSDGGAILNAAAGNWFVPAHSGANILGFNVSPGTAMSNGGLPIGPETVDFSSPVTLVSLFTAVKTSGLPIELDGYLGSALVASDGATSTGNYEELSVSSPAGMDHVVITRSTGSSDFVVDDLSFQPVPEPSTLAILVAVGVGLLAYAWQRNRLRLPAGIAVVALFGVGAARDVFNMPSGQTSLQFVTVGDPGNVANVVVGFSVGNVPYKFNMGKYDVTLGQYVQFLNAVAATDTYGCYNEYIWPAASASIPSASAKAVAQAATHTQSPARTRRPQTCRSTASVGSMRSASVTGCKTDSTPAPKGRPPRRPAQYTLNGDTTSGTESRNTGALVLHPLGKRMVQGRLLRRPRHPRRLLELSHAKQHGAEQLPCVSHVPVERSEL